MAVRRASAGFNRTAIAAVLLFLVSCGGSSSFPTGEYDGLDTLTIHWGEHEGTRPLTEREYNALRAFFDQATWREYDVIPAETAGARITINGTEWDVYRNSLCQDRKRRLVVEGVELNDARGGFDGFEQLIIWAESR